jgi:hypothetical protein
VIYALEDGVKVRVYPLDEKGVRQVDCTCSEETCAIPEGGEVVTINRCVFGFHAVACLRQALSLLFYAILHDTGASAS